MTAVFQDIKAVLCTPKQRQPIPGISYAEVLYADDTLLFGTHTHTINKLLRQIQLESARYIMKLNFEKCYQSHYQSQTILYQIYGWVGGSEENPSKISWSNSNRRN